jgi:hypothetical protein
MPRELRPELEAILATGHVERSPTVDIVLTSGEDIHVSTAERSLNNYGVVEDYAAYIDSMEMTEYGLDQAIDQASFALSNVDRIIGQTVTNAENLLAGALATIGFLFLNPGVTLESGQHYWDPRLPTEISVGEVSKPTVSMKAISEIDTAIISGRKISEEFPYRSYAINPGGISPVNRPIDVPGGGTIVTIPDGGLIFTPGGGRGRWGDIGVRPEETSV